MSLPQLSPWDHMADDCRGIPHIGSAFVMPEPVFGFLMQENPTFPESYVWISLLLPRFTARDRAAASAEHNTDSRDYPQGEGSDPCPNRSAPAVSPRTFDVTVGRRSFPRRNGPRKPESAGMGKVELRVSRQPPAVRATEVGRSPNTRTEQSATTERPDPLMSATVLEFINGAESFSFATSARIRRKGPC